MLTAFWQRGIGREGLWLLCHNREKNILSEDICFASYSSLQSADSPSDVGVTVEVKTVLIIFTMLLKNK